MGFVVYSLCALTSALCAFLLLRGFQASRARLLLWSGLCFVGFAINSFALVLDLGVFVETDLSVWRSLPALLGIALLIYGLIWDSK